MPTDVKTDLVAWLAIADAAGGIGPRESLPPESMWPNMIELSDYFPTFKLKGDSNG